MRITKVAALALASLTSLTSLVNAQEAIKIAVIEPLSGPLAGNGIDIVERFKFLFDKVNEKGGVLGGRQIEVLGYDNGFDVEKTAQQVQRAADEGVDYIINGIGPEHNQAIMNFISKWNRRNPGNEMAFLAHSAGWNGISNEDCSFYTAVFDPTVDMKVKALVSAAKNLKLGSKAFLVNPDYEFGQTVDGSMKKLIEQTDSGLVVAGSELIAPFGQVQDFTPLIARIKASGADLVLTGNFGPDLIRFVGAAADSNLPVKFGTLYGVDPSAMGAIGARRMEKAGVTVATEYHENDTGGVPVLEELNKEFLDVAKTSWGIDRYRYLAEMFTAALEKAGSSEPSKVMAALEGATVQTAGGEAFLRAADHQLIQPYFLVGVDVQAKRPIWFKGENVGFAWKTLEIVSRDVMELPTTCEMKDRPNG